MCEVCRAEEVTDCTLSLSAIFVDGGLGIVRGLWSIAPAVERIFIKAHLLQARKKDDTLTAK